MKSPGIQPGPRRARRRAIPEIALTLAMMSAIPASPASSSNPPPAPAGSPCGGPEYAVLDFWVGEWDVFADERKVGTNRIEKILGGCALLENWTDAMGREGKSLFYRDPVGARWKQVWVTAAGSIKEKSLVDRRDDGSVMFRGVIPSLEGPERHDRTTLSPLGPDRVRQVIEQSTDAGASWNVMFDAVYVRTGAGKTP